MAQPTPSQIKDRLGHVENPHPAMDRAHGRTRGSVASGYEALENGAAAIIRNAPASGALHHRRASAAASGVYGGFSQAL